VRQRLQEYRTKTASLLDYYGAQGRLAEVDGEQQVAEVTRDLLRLVSERAALHDSQPSGTIRGSI
jgi:adenylate kinase family enzyme